MNSFPGNHGASSHYSPNTIVTKNTIDYNKHCKHKFGEYVQAHHKNKNTSHMTELTIDFIYLRPNNNAQGGHVVMNLCTGQRLSRNRVTRISMTSLVKKIVEKMVTDQGIARIKFTNKTGVELPNVDWIAGVDYKEDV